VEGHDLLTFYGNAAGSLLAVAANLYGVRCGDPRLRSLRAAIGALAGFYFFGYVWVIWTGGVADWSAFYRKVALVAWVLVWTFPPLIGSRVYQRTMRAFDHVRGGGP
jgi:hypothetical protein